MEFRLFGEVQLWVDGQPIGLGTPRQQAVLAALAVDAGSPVAIETLIDRVWDDSPPIEARNVLYSHLSRIRQVLKNAAEITGIPARIERRSAGYILEIDPDLVDLHRFTRLVKQRGTDVDRSAALAEALAMWRGIPLAGLAGDWVNQVRQSWQRSRLDAVVRWGELELKGDRPGAVITVLPDLIADYPLSEPLEVLLMRALHAAGRDAEAIDRYTAIRARLADELGTDPGQELRALHAAILRGELPAPARAAGPQATPAQLPPDVYGFAGREDELRRLDTMIGGDSTAVRVVVLSGTAGVGKTALAVHWAHRVRDQFPGGQLYVNLRGFDPTGSPVTPTEALRGFLDAFDVPSQRIPAGFEAQIGLYRSQFTNRRVVVVLDNALDAEQVRPLLPGAPGCLVLVTSRSVLAGLVTSGAEPFPVGLLERTEARDLLAARIGANRAAAEPAALHEIVTLCARLPLALAVVAARAATHPTFGLAALAGELRQARGSLDEFAGADPVTDPRAVFSWSYRQLTEAAARLFRLLGLHSGPDISTAAAASLAGLPPRQVRPLLAELSRAHLVAEQSPGRYGCHDLLRAYASEQTTALDSEEERAATLRRMLGHYIHSANNADRMFDPNREEPPSLSQLPPNVHVEHIADREQSVAWFTAEHRVLLSALSQPCEFDPQVWELAWMLRRYLIHQGLWHHEEVSATAALAAARRLGDPGKQAFAHSYLGSANVWTGKHDDARRQFDVAIELYREAGDQVGEAQVHYAYLWMLDRQARTAEALAHAEQALQLHRSAGNLAGQGKVLNAVGWFHALLGDYEVAVNYCEEALALQTKLGDRLAVGQTWHSLGYVHEHLGDRSKAIRCYQAAVELYRETGYRFSEALSLRYLGDSHHNAGDQDAATAAWQQAVDILDQLGHPDAEDVRRKLKGSEHG
jgi:DNA-binding SARP family transcriptional activator/tetratricopeptide (TPR) repeat protein